MGKAEKGTPKYLANKMKAKGLQKLRWYCQMCEKQCRDENGFKCHTQSESHQRQLLLFADNSGKYLHSFSKEFSDGYVELLRRRFGTKRVCANKVYQEYIANKDHLHMNATKWLTLSDYVKHLGRSGIVVADETEKGWFITYIDRSPEVLERQEKLARKKKQDKDDEERHAEFIQQQIEQNSKSATSIANEYTEMKRADSDERITIAIKPTPLKKDSFLKPSELLTKHSASKSKRKANDLNAEEQPVKVMTIDKTMENQKIEKIERKDYWLAEGIVVKLVTNALGEKYYKEKGVVIDVVERYGGRLRMIDSGKIIKVDQSHCETVIPTIGKLVKILNGAYRGTTAYLRSIDETHYCVSLEIAEGSSKGKVIHNIEYEDISKLFQQ